MPPFVGLIPIQTNGTPRSSSAIAPARGKPFTSFWMPTCGWTRFQTSSGNQCSMTCHWAAFISGVWFMASAATSSRPVSTARSNSLRRAGVAACHQSSTANVVSAVQQNLAPEGFWLLANTASMAMSR